MIKYNLTCINEHEFESWFSDSSEFDKLNKKVFLSVFTVPQKISKSIMAPMVSNLSEKQTDIREKQFIKKKIVLYN